MSAIGYREIVAYLGAEIDLEEAVRQVKRRTRAFVRRQANWFKADDPNIHWFRVGPATVDALEQVIRKMIPIS